MRKKINLIKSGLNPKATAQDGATERSLSFMCFLLPAPLPRRPRCPSSPRIAPGLPGPPSSSPTSSSSRKSQGQPAAQCLPAHSPPWASYPPSLPASQPPFFCTPLGPHDLHGPMQRSQRNYRRVCGHNPLPLPPPSGVPDPSRAVQTGSVRTLELYCT